MFNMGIHVCKYNSGDTDFVQPFQIAIWKHYQTIRLFQLPVFEIISSTNTVSLQGTCYCRGHESVHAKMSLGRL